jgi:hypothetical protein
MEGEVSMEGEMLVEVLETEAPRENQITIG